MVCAAISPQGSNVGLENNLYVQRVATQQPNHLDYVIDVDSEWSAMHHEHGGRQRMEHQPAAHPDAVGVTHYLREEDDGWLRTQVPVDFIGALTADHL